MSMFPVVAALTTNVLLSLATYGAAAASGDAAHPYAFLFLGNGLLSLVGFVSLRSLMSHLGDDE